MNYLFFIFIFLASSTFAQEAIPYSQQFEGNLPFNWTLEGLWSYSTSDGVNNSGAIVAKDHTFILSESTALTPQFNIIGSTSLSMEFDLLTGKFSDGLPTLVVLGNYGNGWVPLLGCSQDTTFTLHNDYPTLPKIKLPPNLYSTSNSNDWIPSKGQTGFQKIRLNLDSLSNHSQIQFKFLAHYYYGGLIFLDNFHITNSTLASIKNNQSSEFKIYPNPALDYINIESEKMFSEVSVYNNLGLSVTCYWVIENKFKINTSSFSPGIYYIKIKELNADNFIYSPFIVR